MIRYLVCAMHMLLGLATSLSSQSYIGAGNDSNITVTTSHQTNWSDWAGSAIGRNTVNGNGLIAPFYEASRFLSQASMGYEKRHIQDVLNMGIDNWINNQMNVPQSLVLPTTYDIWEIVLDSLALEGVDLTGIGIRPYWSQFNYAWWDTNMNNEDLLRHKVAYALSQIFVISKNSELADYGDGLASFYDMLASHAFGSFEELLLDVTLHPTMGFYLSHLNNPKSNPATNQHPDENYAREVMQLFSIGLYELNKDGTRRLDSNGNFIPTYGQDDIREFAKIFTGLSFSAITENPFQGPPTYFGRDLYTSDATAPMMMFNQEHEEGTKYLLNGVVIPSGQLGMKDIEDAIKNISSHPNVAPFISLRLIQRLIKSNPSPAYVERVSNVFNNNGMGERGDLGAVIKAILMDSEARSCAPQQLQSSSRLREPLVRYTQFARMVDKNNLYNYYLNIGYNFYAGTNQDIMHPPSVFNFYLYDHSPVGEISDAGLVAPEFNLHDSRTSIGYMNNVDIWTVPWGQIMENWEGWEDSEVTFDIDYYSSFSQDHEALINDLDAIFCHGQLSTFTKQTIRGLLKQLDPQPWDDYREERVYLAVYLILISPDYAVTR